MKSEYYLIRGWDLETGIPYKETLLEYGLDDVAAGPRVAGHPAGAERERDRRAMKDPTLAYILMDAEEKRGRAAGPNRRFR